MIASENIEFACDEDTTMKPTFTCLQDGTFDATDQVTCPIPPCYTEGSKFLNDVHPPYASMSEIECDVQSLRWDMVRLRGVLIHKVFGRKDPDDFPMGCVIDDTSVSSGSKLWIGEVVVRHVPLPISAFVRLIRAKNSSLLQQQRTASSLDSTAAHNPLGVDHSGGGRRSLASSMAYSPVGIETVCPVSLKNCASEDKCDEGAFCEFDNILLSARFKEKSHVKVCRGGQYVIEHTKGSLPVKYKCTGHASANYEPTEDDDVYRAVSRARRYSCDALSPDTATRFRMWKNAKTDEHCWFDCSPCYDKEEPCDVSDAIDEPPAGLDYGNGVTSSTCTKPGMTMHDTCLPSRGFVAVPRNRGQVNDLYPVPKPGYSVKLITCSTFPDGCHKSVGHWLMFILSLAVVLLFTILLQFFLDCTSRGKTTSNIARRW